MSELSPADIQALREKISRGEGTLEEAMLAVRAIRKSWEALPAAKEKAPKAEKKVKEPSQAFSDDF